MMVKIFERVLKSHSEANRSFESIMHLLKNTVDHLIVITSTTQIMTTASVTHLSIDQIDRIADLNNDHTLLFELRRVSCEISGL